LGNIIKAFPEVLKVMKNAPISPISPVILFALYFSKMAIVSPIFTGLNFSSY
jgi:hypothetical protein